MSAGEDNRPWTRCALCGHRHLEGNEHNCVVFECYKCHSLDLTRHKCNNCGAIDTRRHIDVRERILMGA